MLFGASFFLDWLKMNRNQYDYLHAIVDGSYNFSRHLNTWGYDGFTSTAQFHVYTSTPRNANSFLDNYKHNLDNYEEDDEIDYLSDDLYRHIVATILKNDGTPDLSALVNAVNEIDKFAKTVAILRAYYFFRVANKSVRPNGNYWELVKEANFFNDNFAMIYLYNFIVNAPALREITTVGKNYIDLFTEASAERTRGRLIVANTAIEKLINTNYFHETAKLFYEDYAKSANMTPQKLQDWLSEKLNDSYPFMK